MGKLGKTILTICICAVAIYVFTLVYIHADYRYDKYGMEEIDVIGKATAIYCIVVFFVVLYVLISKSKSKIKEKPDDVAADNLPLEKVEEPKAVEVPVEETTRNKDLDKNNQCIGTGVIGLERWYSCYLIVGMSLICLGTFLLIVALGVGVYLAMIGISLIIGGITCLITTPFIKALITIVKAAKLYIDNNQKEEAQ